MSPYISFIYPRGTMSAAGTKLKKTSDEKTMRAHFSKRARKAITPIEVRRFASDTAVVEFDWDFVVKRDEMGHLAANNMTGRAKCIRSLADLGWRLVYVHYSVPTHHRLALVKASEIVCAVPATPGELSWPAGASGGRFASELTLACAAKQ